MTRLEVVQKKKLRIAQDAARSSTHAKYRLGSALFRGNRLLAIGRNQIKTHPKSPHDYRMVHAEIDVLLRVAPKLIAGTCLLVVRVLRNDTLASSKPCHACWKMAVTLGVKKIIYYDERLSQFISAHV